MWEPPPESLTATGDQTLSLPTFCEALQFALGRDRIGSDHPAILRGWRDARLLDICTGTTALRI